jgi:hypothetical protein
MHNDSRAYDGASGSWRKSTYSGDQGDCVEVAGGHSGIVPVRDSKDPGAEHLAVASASWSGLVVALKRGV